MLPETPMVNVLPNDAQETSALPAPIDQRSFRRPLEPTSRAWSLPAPPAPNHGRAPTSAGIFWKSTWRWTLEKPLVYSVPLRGAEMHV